MVNAGGNKLSRTVTETGQPQKTTQYIGGMIFENNVLQHVATEEGRARIESGVWKFDYFLKDHLGNVRMMLADNGTMLEETHYYPFGLVQKGIGYQNTGYPVNRLKFNGGNELQAGEFSGNVGLELYDAVNRLYDPQLGKFWQVDELSEANWEWSSYNFAIDNPIHFNDPFGLIEGPGHVKELENVTVIAARGLWGKTNLYYQLLRNNINIDNIMNNSLRESMQNIREIVNFRERVADQTRKDDELALQVGVEVGEMFVPMGWITKLKYVKWAAKLFNLKRGKAAVKIVEEVAEHGDEVVEAAKTGTELFNFTGKAASRMADKARAIPIQTMDDIIKAPMSVVKDPQGTSALMHYSQMWKNGKLYNVEVLYDKAANTIMHFKYTQKPLGSLPAIK